jgi:hypothetical protein
MNNSEERELPLGCQRGLEKQVKLALVDNVVMSVVRLQLGSYAQEERSDEVEARSTVEENGVVALTEL